MSTARKKHFDLGEVVRQDLEETEQEQPVAPPTGGVPPAMTLSQIAQVPPDRRRQLNCLVPEELMIHRRLAIYREDHGLSATRQNITALAVDRFLREQGY